MLVDINNPIFQNYFPKDENTANNVKKIFNNIIGDIQSSSQQKKSKKVDDKTPTNELQKDEPCAGILNNIKTVPDFEGGDNGVLACEPDEDDDPDIGSPWADTRDGNADDSDEGRR